MDEEQNGVAFLSVQIVYLVSCRAFLEACPFIDIVAEDSQQRLLGNLIGRYFQARKHMFPRHPKQLHQERTNGRHGDRQTKAAYEAARTQKPEFHISFIFNAQGP